MNSRTIRYSRNSGRPQAAAVRPRLLALAVAACFATTPAWAMPGGAQVIAGSASFANAGNRLTITNAPGTIINWNAFSIGAAESVRFQQENSLSSVLNRVTGKAASSILGELSSNGRVWLINPNGIVFGAGSRVDVAGLIASTLGVSDADFRAGRLDFKAGETAGTLKNAGELNAAAGNIYLIAPDIENSGIVRAPGGEVLLAAGRQVSLVDAAHPDIQVVVSAPADKAVNLGDLVAGRISVFGALVQQKGVASADTASLDAQGRIVFRASQRLDAEAGSRTTANGPAGGSVTLQSAGDTYVAGTVEARGTSAAGGTAQILGQRVAVMDAASVDASGRNGGGTVLVGGDYQGKNPGVQNAEVTWFGPEATLKANAGRAGDGGKVIVWADDTTRAYGSIEARGGERRGDGGFVEVSGKNSLVFKGRADTTAPKGKTGTLLLDPENIQIVGGVGDGSDHTDASPIILQNDAGTAGTILFAENGTGATPFLVTEQEIEAQSASANIVLEARSGISVSGTFNNISSGEASGVVLLGNNSSLTLRTRNASGNAATGIDLTGSTHGSALEFQTQGTGAILIETGIDAAPQAAPIKVGRLSTAGGAITLDATGAVEVAAGGGIKSNGGAINLIASSNGILIAAPVESGPTTALVDGGAITILAEGGGNIVATAPITATGASAVADSTTAFAGGDIDIESLSGSVSLNVVAAAGGQGWNGATLFSHGGDGGMITITAPTGVTFSGAGAGINTPGGQGYGSTGTGGGGGDVSITGGPMTLFAINTVGGNAPGTSLGGGGGLVDIASTGAIVANDLISAWGGSGSTLGLGGDIDIVGTALSFPTAVSDVQTNNAGTILLQATAGSIVQAGSTSGALISGPEVILKATAGIHGGSTNPLVLNGSAQVDIENTSGTVHVSSNSAYTVADIVHASDTDTYSLKTDGSSSVMIYNANNAITVNGSVSLGSAEVQFDAGTANLVSNAALSSTGQSIHFRGGSVTLNENVSAKNVEFWTDSVTVAATKSVTSTGTADNGDGIRFSQKTANGTIVLGTTGGPLLIDPADLGVSGKKFNSPYFEFDAGSTGSVQVTSAVNLPGSFLGLEGSAVYLYESVHAKAPRFMTDSISFSANTAHQLTSDPTYGISIGPYTASRAIALSSASVGGALWIDTLVLNDTANPRIVGRLEIGHTTSGGVPSNTGNITIDSDVIGSATTFKSLMLATSGTITQTGKITLPAYNATTCTDCGGLKIAGGGPVTLENTANSVDFLTATMSSPAAFSFVNSKSLKVGGIQSAGGNVSLNIANGDLLSNPPGIDACYGLTTACASTVSLTTAPGFNISTALIRAATVSLMSGGNVIDGDSSGNNIVSGNSGVPVNLSYQVSGSIDLDAWGATIAGGSIAGSGSVRLSQPASGGGGGTVAPPPPPPPPPEDPCVTDPASCAPPPSGGGTTTPTAPLTDKITCLVDPAACTAGGGTGGGGTSGGTTATVQTIVQEIEVAEQQFVLTSQTALNTTGTVDLALVTVTAPGSTTTAPAPAPASTTGTGGGTAPAADATGGTAPAPAPAGEPTGSTPAKEEEKAKETTAAVADGTTKPGESNASKPIGFCN